MSRRLAPLLTVAALVLVPSTALAKDLRNRVGIGFETGFGQVDVDALSVRWGVPTSDPAINIQLEADLGFISYKNTSDTIFAGGRLLYGVVAEDNMNLYVGAGAGYLGYGTQNLVRIQPVASVDFFLFGLENLGLNASWGLNLDVGDTAGLATTANLGAGLHYFF